QTECWMAVNNTVAQSVEDFGINSGLRSLRVPTMNMTLLRKDSTDVVVATQLLFKTLQYNETLSVVASSGYTKKSHKMRAHALRTHALHVSKEESRGNQTGRDWETASNASYMSENRSIYSTADSNWDATSASVAPSGTVPSLSLYISF
ncbi:hypothetical protein KIPB_014888, partial [Kipferlia bialata]